MFPVVLLGKQLCFAVESCHPHSGSEENEAQATVPSSANLSFPSVKVAKLSLRANANKHTYTTKNKPFPETTTTQGVTKFPTEAIVSHFT